MNSGRLGQRQVDTDDTFVRSEMEIKWLASTLTNKARRLSMRNYTLDAAKIKVDTDASSVARASLERKILAEAPASLVWHWRNLGELRQIDCHRDTESDRTTYCVKNLQDLSTEPLSVNVPDGSCQLNGV